MGRSSAAVASVIVGTIFQLLYKNIVPAAKRVGVELFENAESEIANVLGGSKKFQTSAKSLGTQTLRKQLGSGTK